MKGFYYIINITDGNIEERNVSPIPNNSDSQLTASRQTLGLLAQLFNINESHLKPINWSYLYTREDVDLCMSKIKLVGYNERLSLYGRNILFFFSNKMRLDNRKS